MKFDKMRLSIMSLATNNFRLKFLQSNFLLWFVILLLVLKIGTTVISINFPQNIFFADITKSALQNFVNQSRQAIGLKPLAENEKLNQAAKLKAENMVQNQYFEHTSPSGVSPWFWFTKAGYVYKYAGENLAIGFFESNEVYQAWLNSPSHKANILNPNYTEVGTAVLNGFGGNNTIVVVQEFGSPKTAKQAVAPKTNLVVKTPAPVPDPDLDTKPASPISEEKVLSQSTESSVSIKPLGQGLINNVSARVLNSVIYNYEDLLQGIVYGIAIIVIGVLLTMIFFNSNFEQKIIFRAVLLIVLLSATTLINKELIVSFIPHQILI